MSLDLEALQDPITRILTAPGTDLSTISARRVRKTLLQDPAYAFLGLTPELLKTQRTDVDQVIAQIFEQVNQTASGGAKRGRDEDDEVDDADGRHPAEPSEDADEVPTLPKKKKSKKSLEESDAALARKLSTEINSRSRRGASLATGASSPRKAKRRTRKSAATVDEEDEDEEGAAKPKKRSAPRGGFGKEYTLSVPLSAVLAVEKMSRPQVVKKLWEYIRRHELQNPLNRKEIICDDALRAVFAVDKIDMFRMNKVLGQHLHDE